MERKYTKIFDWSLCETCTMDIYHHIVIRSLESSVKCRSRCGDFLCLLLGNSLGGGLAACLALQRPGFFKGAALLQLTGVQLCTTVDGWNQEILGILPNDYYIVMGWREKLGTCRVTSPIKVAPKVQKPQFCHIFFLIFAFFFIFNNLSLCDFMRSYSFARCWRLVKKSSHLGSCKWSSNTFWLDCVVTEIKFASQHSVMKGLPPWEFVLIGT